MKAKGEKGRTIEHEITSKIPLLTLLAPGYLRVFSCSHARMKTIHENTLLEHSKSVLEGVRVNTMKS